MAEPTDLILSRMQSSRTSHGVLYANMDIAAVTADARSRHTWLPPERASAPKMLMTTTSDKVSTINGIRETAHDGSRLCSVWSPCLFLFIKPAICCQEYMK